MAKTPADAPRARKRRSPEETRELILDAAESLFVERGPDAVTMQDVATRAQISRPLALHYFERYEELVRAVLRRRNARLGQEVLGALLRAEGPLETEALLRALTTALGDPAHARLLTWAALSGEASRLAVAKNAGLTRVVDAIEARVERGRASRKRPSKRSVTRGQIEDSMLLSAAAVLGFATCRSLLLPAFGHADDEASARRFERALRAWLVQPLLEGDEEGEDPSRDRE